MTYAEARSFAQTTGQALEKEHPKLIVSDMAKALRRGKVFIDWSQNSDFKTTVGVYSLRAKNGLPYISAPVTWEELRRLVKKKDAETLRFGPEALLRRVEQIGDLFSPLLTLEQTLSSANRSKGTALVERNRSNEASPKPKANSKVAKAGTASAKFVEPMLLLKTDALPEGDDWSYELKLDGYRAIAMKTNGEVELRSRNDKDFGGKFSSIVTALEKLPDETMIDGEVVALDEEGRPSFNLLQNYGSFQAPLIYYAFDVLMLNGKNAMDLPLAERRAILQDK